ncbi:bifunctional folylpolyglutamate synthase/dihydrofolate synthase [Mycobacterium sp. KBS0706]|uniref:bifunctional folylpolyglutamate synthase/dihydrofolate synthase n=1 Tax=Mycobacterium sp. KBS0706 TaxID=2578109 RepID=UPI00110FDB79|nr:folylpolyglutamate synthase/dihydrofolate synthase family protein [Mycobacterium sp. KBS0706]TSD89951.1 bifunctional folylpolyglutamate synthase/dihydrofolate synthase [Mycobacterium sp. KBS0706]
MPDASAAAVEAALDRLTHLHPKRIDLSLGRTERLLAALGDPQLRLPPVVHIGGTNGKGSTTAFLRAFLEQAGYRVHVYTSPHLVRFHERIRLAGALIDSAALVELLERVEAANAGQPVTFFEATTAAAFLGFAEVPADVVLLEVGLGGRYDSTNVVPRPAATAVTRISMDHMQFLGDTIEAIAAEKAAIAKPGVPMVVAPQLSAAAVSVLTRDIESAGAPLHLAGRDWSVAPAPDGFVLRTAAGDRAYPRPALPGDHQFANAATAIRLRDLLAGFDIPEEAVRSGLAAVEWPARLQRLTRGPLAGLLPPGWELWLDGGHNDSAGEVLGQWLGGLDKRPLHLVCGMLESKQPQEFLRPLAPFVRSIRTVRIPGEEASLPAEAVADHARAVGLTDVATAEDVTAAVAAAARPGDPPGRVLICGSLYLAGRVLAANG